MQKVYLMISNYKVWEMMDSRWLNNMLQKEEWINQKIKNHDDRNDCQNYCMSPLM